MSRSVGNRRAWQDSRSSLSVAETSFSHSPSLYLCFSIQYLDD